MTTPQPTGWDQGNALLAPCSAQLVTSMIMTPAGQGMAVTVRTPSTTLTVILNSDEAVKWAAQMTREASGMSKSGLVVANGHNPVSELRQPG